MKRLKFLVTGGAGFIGSEVVKQLVNSGYYVRIADNLSKAHFHGNEKKGVNFHKVDLTDYKATLEVFDSIDICINLAAKIGGIGYFHKYPATILSDNNLIYSNTFTAAVKNKLSRMVYISSSMVYESTDSFPSNEDDVEKIPVPKTSYGLSKLVGEWYCKAFWQEYKLKYSIIRPFNAYGINEYPSEEVGYAHVIPDLIRKIIGGQYPLEILGSGKQSRCFTHVSDIASGIINASLSEKGINQAFNISHPTEITIVDLAKKLWNISGRNEQFKVKLLPSFTFDIQRRIPNTEKAKSMLGWHAKTSLDVGLKEVVKWLKDIYE